MSTPMEKYASPSDPVISAVLKQCEQRPGYGGILSPLREAGAALEKGEFNYAAARCIDAADKLKDSTDNFGNTLRSTILDKAIHILLTDIEVRKPSRFDPPEKTSSEDKINREQAIAGLHEEIARIAKMLGRDFVVNTHIMEAVKEWGNAADVAWGAGDSRKAMMFDARAFNLRKSHPSLFPELRTE